MNWILRGVLISASLLYLPACERQAASTSAPQAASSQSAAQAAAVPQTQQAQPVVLVTDTSELEKLRGQTHLKADLRIQRVDTLDALAELQELDGSLELRHCRLADLRGLGALQRIAGDLSLDAELIQSFAGLQQLQSIGGSLSITGSKRFAANAVQDFARLQQIGGNLRIEGCKIEGAERGPWHLGPFAQLTHIGGDLSLRNFCGEQPGAVFFPMQINGFGSLAEIGGSLYLDCPERVESFAALAKIGGKIRIKGCPRAPGMEVLPLIKDKGIE